MENGHFAFLSPGGMLFILGSLESA